MCHIIAEPMSEVCRINTRICPASYTVCDSERDFRRGIDAGYEESILARARTRAFVFSPREDAVVGVEVEDVGIGVVAVVFC